MLPGESKLTMVLPLDDLGNNLNNGERNNKFRTFLRPFSEEEQHLPDVEKNTIDQRDAQITEKISVIKNETEVVKPEYPGKKEENPTSFFRTLIKSSGIYALSSMASPLIALILAPFLTRNLSHSEYGALVILNTAIALIAG